jgi:glycine/D-amino acid oxidase-like deaminating enzyme
MDCSRTLQAPARAGAGWGVDMKGNDFLVIGGGLVGSSVAWGLARSDARVAVLDEADVAFRAARANFGLVWVQGKGLGKPEYSSWTRASASLWPTLSDRLRSETGIDPGFSQPGGFSLRLSETELRPGVDAMERLQHQPNMEPYPYEVLDHRETKARLPGIGPEVVGSIYCPLDGHANPLRLYRALHSALRSRGAAYLPNHVVERISCVGKAFRVEGPWGAMSAPRLVLAAGLGSARLAPMVGLKVPLVPSRGQIIVTERTTPFLHHPLGNIRQVDEGGIIIGESKEATMDHQRPRTSVTAVLADRAMRMFPRIGNLNVMRIWAAFRVVTPDGFPIYEQSRSCPGAFAVVCHSGVTLAANHAFAIADHIASGTLPASLSSFSSERFDVSAAA